MLTTRISGNWFWRRLQGERDHVRIDAIGLPRQSDAAATAAYAWSILDLGHGFHATKQGERYTLSEPARSTVLGRFLQLNHQRYAAEVAAGLHAKGAKKRPKANPAAPPQTDLLSPQEDLVG
jgi:hypothetical protein